MNDQSTQGPPRASKNVRISVTIRPRFLAQLDALAHQNETGRTQTAAVLLEQALAERMAPGGGATTSRPVGLPPIAGAGQ